MSFQNRYAFTLRNTFLTGIWITIFGGCSSNTLHDDPRDIWMTHKDGILSFGENGYYDASDDILRGDVHAKRYESYAFVHIVIGSERASDSKVISALKSSLAQCRQTYAAAFRSGELRQIDSLVNLNTRHSKAAFKPKYIVFLISLKRPPEGATGWETPADYGAVIAVGDVFSTEKSLEKVMTITKIIAKPQVLRRPAQTVKDFNYWKDMEFTILDQFERVEKQRCQEPNK